MKSRLSKIITSLILVAALAFSGISYQGKEAKAADNYTPLFSIDNWGETDPILPKDEEVTQTFNVSSNGTIDLLVFTSSKATMNLKITSSTGTTICDETFLGSDPSWLEDTTIVPGYTMYCNGITWKNPTAGSYTMSLKFDDDMLLYSASAVQGPAVQTPTQKPTQAPTQTPTQAPRPTYTPSLSAQNLTLTAGFSADISVRLTSEAITWSSSNNSVATVSNGKITGKKAGSATITAKTASGYTMTCRVNVIKNEYKLKKLSVKKVTYGKSGIDIYNISYDKKGNLVLKTRVLNNSSYKLKELRNVKIKIKDNNGKTIGTYSVKKIKKVNLKAGKAKAYTFKIKKSKLKNKKANLPLISTSVSGKAYYVR